jgi:hypothetical protein
MMLQKRRLIGIYLVIFSFLLVGCTTYTKSGDAGLNRTISIKVTSGNVSMSLSGHISENIYTSVENDLEKQNFPNEKTPMVSQGKVTINQDFVLYQTQNFEYTLTGAEVLAINVRSIDDNDAQLTVTEYGKEKAYKIDGKNKAGHIISFKN